jgi:broad specificity phosphatase PhoE
MLDPRPVAGRAVKRVKVELPSTSCLGTSMGTIITTNGPRILLVRHGECQSNLHFELSTYREETDALTVRGERQARHAGAAAARIVGTSNPLLVSSTLLRATQTASLIAGALGVAEIQLDERFAELSSLEDEAAFLTRTSGALRELLDSRRNAVVVTHGHVIQSAVALSLKIPFSQTKTLYPFNGGITTLNDGVLESFNLHQHLGESARC